MDILLTDEEIENLLGVEFKQEYSGHVAEWKAVAEAQVKKIVKFLKEHWYWEILKGEVAEFNSLSLCDPDDPRYHNAENI